MESRLATIRDPVWRPLLEKRLPRMGLDDGGERGRRLSGHHAADLPGGSHPQQLGTGRLAGPQGAHGRPADIYTAASAEAASAALEAWPRARGGGAFRGSSGCGVRGGMTSSIAGLQALLTPDFARESSRLETRGALRAPPDLVCLSRPDLPRPSRRTSRALHPVLPVPFTPDFPRPSLCTSRALHAGPPAPFTLYLPCPSLRTSRALHSLPPAPFTRTPAPFTPRSSPTVFPLTGSTSSGAMCASGSSTNRRSRNRG